MLNFYYELRFISSPTIGFICTRVVMEKKMTTIQAASGSKFALSLHSEDVNECPYRLKGPNLFASWKLFHSRRYCPLDPSSAPVLIQWNHSVAVNRKIAPGSLFYRVYRRVYLSSFSLHIHVCFLSNPFSFFHISLRKLELSSRFYAERSISVLPTFILLSLL